MNRIILSLTLLASVSQTSKAMQQPPPTPSPAATTLISHIPPVFDPETNYKEIMREGNQIQKMLKEKIDQTNDLEEKLLLLGTLWNTQMRQRDVYMQTRNAKRKELRDRAWQERNEHLTLAGIFAGTIAVINTFRSRL